MSSHREAPEISKDPVADSTDVYAFVDSDTTATLIANYVPLQAPDGGPNFYEFGSEVLYEIHIDNNGDAKPDISYQFRFTSVLTNPDTFLYNDGPITITNGRLDAAAWNRRQYFSVTKVVGTTSTLLASNLACPPCNIGPLSTPDYQKGSGSDPDPLTQAFIYTLPSGEKVFAGQRAEGFYVDLGAVFDLGDLRPIAEDHATFGLPVLQGMPGVNSTAAVNVHSIAIQVPIAGLSASGAAPTDPSKPASVIGVWTTASRQTATMRSASGHPTYSGPYVQVSRLGNPLFNEVLVPISKKDAWNAAPPAGDSAYADGVAKPELGTLIPVLYTPDGGSTLFPHLAAYNQDIANGTAKRDDLVAILLTGIPAGVVSDTFSTFTGTTQADMLRLNLAIPPTPTSSSSFSNLGVIDGDVAGFPNGRRVYDDVAVIELRAIAGATLPLTTSDPTYVPDGAVADVDDGLVKGATPDDPSGRDNTDITVNGTVAYLTSFPYLGTPHDGYYTPATTPAAVPPNAAPTNS